MKKIFGTGLVTIFLLAANSAFSQQADTTQAAKVQEQIVKEEKSMNNIEDKIEKSDRKANKALKKAKRQEAKMNKALRRAKKEERKKEKELKKLEKKQEKMNDLKKDTGTQGSSQ